MRCPNNLICLLIAALFFALSCGDDEPTKPVTNKPPLASFVVTPDSGIIETIFDFDASGSSDSQDPDSALRVRWDWENNGTYNTEWTTTKTASHQYTTAGTKVVKLEVENTRGWRDAEIHRVVVEYLRCGTVTDYDGNVYQTMQIGDQCWMAENLKVTHYRNGDPIPNVTSASEWHGLAAGAYCNYDNNANNADTYGRLYNWYAVNDSRNIAPSGWHVPTDEEWKELEMYLGMSQSEADDDGWRGTNEGSRLAGNASSWYSGDLENNPGFGTSGFTALPAGYRYYDGSFYYLGNYARFWSATESYSGLAWSRHLGYSLAQVPRYYYLEGNGFSLRCVRD